MSKGYTPRLRWLNGGYAGLLAREKGITFPVRRRKTTREKHGEGIRVGGLLARLAWCKPCRSPDRGEKKKVAEHDYTANGREGEGGKVVCQKQKQGE